MRTPPPRHLRRPRHRGVTTAGILVLTVATLSGCSAAPAPAPSDTAAPPVAEITVAPTETPPVFASNEEALAAAMTFYSSYQGMANTISREGGTDPERIAPFVAADMLAGEIASFERLATRDIHLVGDLAFDSMSLQSANLTAGSLVVYMCLDVSATDVVDVAGVSVVPSDRVPRHPLQVALTQDAKANRLLLEKSELWTGADFC